MPHLAASPLPDLAFRTPRKSLADRVTNSSRDKSLGPEALYEYDLFAVVCHEGQMDNGHYTCYARSQDEVRSVPVPLCLPRVPYRPGMFTQADNFHPRPLVAPHLCISASLLPRVGAAAILSGIATMTTSECHH